MLALVLATSLPLYRNLPLRVKLAEYKGQDFRTLVIRLENRQSSQV